MRRLLPLAALLFLPGPGLAQDNPLLLRPDQFQAAPRSPLEQERARAYRDQLLIDRAPLQSDLNAGRLDPLKQQDLRALSLEQQRMDEVLTRPQRSATPSEAEIRQNLRPDPPLAGSQHRQAPASSARPNKQPRPKKPPTQDEIDEVYGRK